MSDTVVSFQGLTVVQVSQNQAAVAGACALKILRDLGLTAARDQPGPKQMLFSVVTEGPTHELWVHYQVDQAYHSTLLRSWRTTIAREAKELVNAVGRISAWGAGELREGVLKELTAIAMLLSEGMTE